MVYETNWCVKYINNGIIYIQKNKWVEVKEQIWFKLDDVYFDFMIL